MGDVDLGLRIVSGLLPADLAAPLVEAGTRLEAGELPDVLRTVEDKDSQLVRRELRVDKILAVRLGGAERLLHVEFQTQADPDLGLRVLEYASAVAMLVLLRDERRVPVMSVVVQLEGAADLVPGWLRVPVGWPERPEGQHATYWLEPVYRYRLAELRARPVLWWVFAPLAQDVDEAGLDDLLHALRERVDNQRVLAELGSTMRVIADRNRRVPGLGERIVAWLGEEVIMESEFLRQIMERGRREGEQIGRREGEQIGRREELLAVAARLATAAELERLRSIDDLDALHDEVLALIDTRAANSDDSGG